MSGKPFDATVKELIEADPMAWAARYCRRPVLEATLVESELSTLTAAADRVIRVRQPWGECLVNLEAESGHAGEAPGQLLPYSAALNRREEVPVRSVLLLLRPGAEAEAATGVLKKYHRPPQQREPGEEPYLVFRYEVVRVWRMRSEELLTGPLAFCRWPL
jgi:hypothetical protein